MAAPRAEPLSIADVAALSSSLGAAWVILAVIILGLDAVGIPHAYARYRKTCTSTACVESDGSPPKESETCNNLGHFARVLRRERRRRSSRPSSRWYSSR